MAKFLLSLTLIAMMGWQTTLARAPSCMEARSKCIHRLGCSMALNNFQIACQQVKLGMVDYCTESCKRAVISLVTVDDNIGTDYLTCDCDGNEDCALWKKRITLCSDDVLAALETLDNEEVISCSLARMLCEANTVCFTSLDYYEENCKNLWERHSTNLECSERCNNSLNILNKQPRAAKLDNCLCDNSDPLVSEDTCIRMKYNTKTYCQNEEPDKSFYVNELNQAGDGSLQDDTIGSNMKIKINTAPITSQGSKVVLSSALSILVAFTLNIT